MGIERIGICGSGIMGSGIVQAAAQAGHDAFLRSRSPESATATRDAVAARLDKLVARERLSADDRDATMARITTTDELDALADCDLVIESVVEDLEVKRLLFAELDSVCKPHTLLATNTSTLPVVELAMSTGRPSQVCGVHFFNPVHAMPLVEIVRPLTASDDTVAAVREFAVRCGKSPVEVKDEAGFVVNALLFPYLNSAIAMLERGTASMEDIDAAMQGGANFPMGPFALLDLVGLDTSLAILDALHAEFGRPCDAAAPTLRRLVAAGRLGRKTGQGFYSY
ncbi:MAG: 3-hydroxybutyryl-CoA dehydrogenase [Actinomycetota bacterium]